MDVRRSTAERTATTLAPHPGDPPPEATRLVGRDRDLDELRPLLATTRLLTLAGPGGSGKTRLAVRLARECGPDSPDGPIVRWVDLAPLEDPALVPHWVAAAAGVLEAPGRPVLPAVVEALAGRPAVVVLDNCEHLVDAAARTAAELMRALPGLHLLVTSREPLGLQGEVIWPVPPLAVPPEDLLEDTRQLLAWPAVDLFTDRVAAVCPALAFDDDGVRTVARLCRLLDGLPLALELAAARIRVLSPAQLLERLEHDLALLADRGRTASPRQRTLLATMDWSHDLLTREERRLFRRLAVFAGSFGLDAAAAVAAPGGPAATRMVDGLAGLQEKSLLTVQHDADGGSARYRMLETVRRYAAGHLDRARERAAVQDRHADHYLGVARVAEPGLNGPDQPAWVMRLAREHADLTAALSWLHESGDVERGLRLAGLLGRYWWFSGSFTEGAAWLTTFLDLAADRPPDADRARALHAMGMATFWHESSEAGVVASRAWFEQAAEIYRGLGDEWALGEVLRDLGGYWKGQGDLARGQAVLEESAATAERVGNPLGAAAAHCYLGIVHAYAGHLREAHDLLTAAYAVLEGRAGADESLRTLFFIGCVECDSGDPASARPRFEELMERHAIAGLPYAAPFCLDGLARLAVAEGQPHRALRVAGAAAALHRRHGTSAGPAYDRYVRRGIEPAIEALGPAAAERALAQGAVLPFEAAVAEGLRRPSPVPEPRDGAVPLLSAREAEVLHLVAEGLSDAAIAGTLHLSPRTVGNHLGSVYRKLGVGSRTAAVREATELHLLG
jgi:non-specific serine/threonine protein kinase